RREIAEHPADRGEPAADMSDRPGDPDGGGELAAPGIDDDDRQDREGRAEEHDLADRVAIAEIAHQHDHHGEQERRSDLEQNGLDELHAPRAPAAARRRRRDGRRLIDHGAGPRGSGAARLSWATDAAARRGGPKPHRHEEDFTMATYVVLGSFTEQGIKNVTDTTKRSDAVRAMAKKAGGTMQE